MKKHSINFALSILAMMLLVFFLACEEDEDNGSTPEEAGFKINNVSGPDIRDCGGYEWKVSFELDNTSDSGGYFVQEVRIHRKATVECPTNYTEVDITYYEVWKVNAGQKLSQYLQADPDDYDDMYRWSSWDHSEGFHNCDGDLRYYEDLDLPASFIPNNPNTYAGVLPSTRTKPDFWGNDEETLAHNLETIWDCCDDSSSILITTPDFTPQQEEAPDPSGGKFFQEVESLKAWSASPYDAADNEWLMSMAFELQGLSTEEIMTGVMQYNDYYRGFLDPMSKLYVMLRVLFDVPQSIPMDQAKVFGGWVRPEAFLEGGETNLLWPLGPGSYPAPVVQEEFMGYFGAGYDAYGEAQYFLESFGRREF